jgi:ABC-type transport system involved in multi-copper enzyme maturation permease subunit
MRKVMAIALAVVSDALRRKVVWAVIVFAALLAVAIPSLPSYGTGVDAAVFRDFAIALTFAASLVVVIALSVTRVPNEVERRTVFTILGRDVARWQYLLGTWIGVVLVMAGVELAFLAVTVGIGWITYGEPAFQLAEASLAILLECGIVAAFCIMVTARLGVVTAAVAALAFLFIGHSVSGLASGGAEGATAPWWVPSLDVFNVINPVAHGTGIGLPYAAAMVAAFAVWCAILLLGGAALFQGRDL